MNPFLTHALKWAEKEEDQFPDPTLEDLNSLDNSAAFLIVSETSQSWSNATSWVCTQVWTRKPHDNTRVSLHQTAMLQKLLRNRPKSESASTWCNFGRGFTQPKQSLICIRNTFPSRRRSQSKRGSTSSSATRRSAARARRVCQKWSYSSQYTRWHRTYEHSRLHGVLLTYKNWPGFQQK